MRFFLIQWSLESRVLEFLTKDLRFVFFFFGVPSDHEFEIFFNSCCPKWKVYLSLKRALSFAYRYALLILFPLPKDSVILSVIMFPRLTSFTLPFSLFCFFLFCFFLRVLHSPHAQHCRVFISFFIISTTGQAICLAVTG